MRIFKNGGWCGVAWTGSIAWLLAGCAGEDVSAGAVGTIVNASRCYGATCDAEVHTSLLPESPRRPCDATPPALIEDFFVEDQAGTVVMVAPSADGAVWVLHENQNSGPQVSYWLTRHDAAGALIATTSLLGLGPDYQYGRSHLDVTPDGEALLVTYAISVTESADDPFTEAVTLRRFAVDGSESGPSTVLGAIAESTLSADATGLTVAGNGPQNAHSGSLIRLDAAGEPRWVQTQLITDGQGVGAGVCGLVVHADGTSTVLSERSSNFETRRASFGISRFGADGNLVADWSIPTSMEAGYRTKLASDAEKNLFFAGTIGDNAGSVGGAALVFESFPADGSPGWAFEVPTHPAYTPRAIVMDSAGRAVLASAKGLVLVDPGGTSCAVAELKGPGEYEWRAPDSLGYADGAFYYGTQYGFGRLHLAE